MLQSVRRAITLIPVIGDIYIVSSRLAEMEITKARLTYVILLLVGVVIFAGLIYGTAGGENDIVVDAAVNHLSQDRNTDFALVKIDEMQGSLTYLTVAVALVLFFLLCACKARALHYVLRGRHTERKRKEHVQADRDRLDKVESTAEQVKWRLDRMTNVLAKNKTIGESDLREIDLERPSSPPLPQAPDA